MRTRLTLAAAATAAVTLPAALLISAGPAGATDWNGRDSAGTSCANDAQTIQTVHLKYNGNSINATIWLRYSPSCRTAWAHISDATAPEPGDSAGGAAAIHRSDGLRYACNAGADGSCSTAMVNDAGFSAYAHGTDDTGFAIYEASTGSY